MSKYGTLGLDVGVVGRLTRLAFGIGLILLGLSILSFNQSLTFFGLTLLFFAVIVVAYIAAHYILGERILARRNPWIGTAILVIPMIYLLFSALLGIGIGRWIGFPGIDWSLSTAAILYVGISFLFSWKTHYGGCEVMGIPNIFFKRSYRTYCIPLVLVDAVEKKIVDNKG